MSSKIISYDLCAPGRNYDELYKAIKAYGTWARITESTWFIKTNSTCNQIRDNLISYMDGNDRLFVGELEGSAAWHNVICKSSFLKENL